MRFNLTYAKKKEVREKSTQYKQCSSESKKSPSFNTNHYRFKELYDTGGEEALIEISRNKPLMANRGDPHVEKAVVDIAVQEPAWGQLRASTELQKQGIIVSAGGVCSIWIRHDLNNFKKRLKALEKQKNARVILFL